MTLQLLVGVLEAENLETVFSRQIFLAQPNLRQIFLAQPNLLEGKSSKPSNPTSSAKDPIIRAYCSRYIDLMTTHWHKKHVGILYGEGSEAVWVFLRTERRVFLQCWAHEIPTEHQLYSTDKASTLQHRQSINGINFAC
ncbi:hypothetical protein ACFX2J_023377 [Malus domestica]